MAWQIAITLAAIGALVLFHGAVASEQPAAAAEADMSAPAAAAAPRERDPWARILVIAACAAGLLAIGVIVVPALTGDDEAASTSPPVPTTTLTSPTTTAPPTTTTGTSTSTSTTTIHLTTTSPTTTVRTSPPAGSVVVARAQVRANGRSTVTVNKLGETFVVRRTRTGEYRIRFPGLSDRARLRSAVSVKAGSKTAAVAGWSPNGTLVVLLFDRKSGQPVSGDFTIAVAGPPLPPTR